MLPNPVQSISYGKDNTASKNGSKGITDGFRCRSKVLTSVSNASLTRVKQPYGINILSIASKEVE